MDRESVERLRFDRRLQLRRGWVEESDLTAEIEALPDVSSKMTTSAELEAEEAAAAAAEPPAASLSPAPPVFERPASVVGTPGGVAGDFSSSSTLTSRTASQPAGRTGSGFGSDSGDTSES